MAKRVYCNNDWFFTRKFDEALIKDRYVSADLEQVRIPHTCKETPFHYFDEGIYQMVSGYRKEFEADSKWQEKEVFLTFDAVGHDAEVFLNGEKIGEHHCGYTAFTMNITKQLRFDEKNILAVKVDSRETLNVPPFGFVVDYMTYGGIYRDVYFDVYNPDYIADVFVKNEVLSVKEKKARLISEITVSGAKGEFYVRESIRKDQTGEFAVLGETKLSGEKLTLSYEMDEVALWDTECPNLYEVKVELLKDGALCDEKIIRTGFRKAEFLKDGFYLNDKKFKIRGLNRHQSYPYVGYAMPESMQKMDADILKQELGLNAVRTSHYPQSHYFLERCDELGLLVFTEIPGWQHIGDEEWKAQAVENVKDMVLQYRNHTSIILWGVRINESQDDDAFYEKTNAMAHSCDDSRPTGGVRACKKSSLLEDVYTYNDFIHAGNNKGCEKKADVTANAEKPYLVSEYNGHMYPTKAYDQEDRRVSHALRHANVLDAVAAEDDIAGSFGWCMFDYNTHKDFGSGDRICYHGVMDMFRNPKMAAAIYECQQEEHPVLELSSSMDIGEHPACNRGETYIFTNAKKVRMYKNDQFIKEYEAANSTYKNLKHGPILIDDYIGDALKNENFKPTQEAYVKCLLNGVARYGMGGLTKSMYAKAAWLILRYRMSMDEAVVLYNKYVGDWGGTSTSYRFEAIDCDKDGKNEVVVKTLTKQPMTQVVMTAKADHVDLKENHTYDVAAVRIMAKDEFDNVLPFFNDLVSFETSGPIEIIGPKTIALQGGMGGTYVRTNPVAGKEEKATLYIHSEQSETIKIEFTVSA